MMPYTKEDKMDINISRYNQEEVVNQDLDLVHLLILEWYIVSKEENTIESKIIDDETYHYINYEQVANDLPIIRLCGETIRRRYKKLVVGEKPESAAFLSKHALGLSLVSRGELQFANAAPRS